MSALVRYQVALLLRSQRWLPPVLLYGVFLVVGVRPGQPVLDSLGYAAAGLLPVTAWLVRICTANEPPAARDCAAAATSPARVHLACLLAALGGAVVLGGVATAVVALISKAASGDGRVAVLPGPAALAGLLAVLVCALVGAAVGALCTRPLLRRPGWSVPATALGALLALVAAGSPARSAVAGLVTGSRTGAVHTPVVPFVLAALIAGGAAAVVCALSSRRG
ncbi:ABC transporter [Streptomyces sp. Wb2n-11]|uniref:ABC transporter n=1 Tax=Streptomyces sp. Wb2n-11 TaxID=1030533 RepID=UPI000A5FE890|nr:ABC transporter [Streptomyces sp. Wb2n-11]